VPIPSVPEVTTPAVVASPASAIERLDNLIKSPGMVLPASHRDKTPPRHSASSSIGAAAAIGDASVSCHSQEELTGRDESEKLAAKMKGLDRPSSRSSASTAAGAASAAVSSRPHKDVNTFVNNQLKFVSAPHSIPPENMKCNILKAVAEERCKRASAEHLAAEAPSLDETKSSEEVEDEVDEGDDNDDVETSQGDTSPVFYEKNALSYYSKSSAAKEDRRHLLSASPPPQPVEQNGRSSRRRLKLDGGASPAVIVETVFNHGGGSSNSKNHKTSSSTSRMVFQKAELTDVGTSNISPSSTSRSTNCDTTDSNTEVLSPWHVTSMNTGNSSSSVAFGAGRKSSSSIKQPVSVRGYPLTTEL
jgi:hypothetical protein